MPSEEHSGYELVGGHRIAYVRHDAAGDARAIVVMAHGFHGGKIGPSRYFVILARALAARGVSSFRFDQPGNGDSSDEFEKSSFNNWVANIEHFARKFKTAGHRVALLGQSMGGTATVAAAARLSGVLGGVALWSPGPMLYRPSPSAADDWMEESGERVRARFWHEAESTDFLPAYRAIDAPVFMTFGTADQVIGVDEMRRVEAVCKPADRIDVIEALPHSAWPYQARTEIIAETADFLVAHLAAGDAST